MRVRVVAECLLNTAILHCIDSLVKVLDDEFDLGSERGQSVKRNLPQETSSTENAAKLTRKLAQVKAKVKSSKEENENRRWT